MTPHNIQEQLFDLLKQRNEEITEVDEELNVAKESQEASSIRLIRLEMMLALFVDESSRLIRGFKQSNKVMAIKAKNGLSALVDSYWEVEGE